MQNEWNATSAATEAAGTGGMGSRVGSNFDDLLLASLSVPEFSH